MTASPVTPETPADITPPFRLGRLLATPGALDALAQHHVAPLTLLARHAAGDFGDIDAEDRRTNLAALHNGGRIVSAYRIAPDTVIWIISEADRASTTLLLPAEY